MYIPKVLFNWLELRMSFSNLLLKNLLAEPQNTVNFDKLDPKTRRAISALEAISEYKQPTYFMWTKAWPWLESISRGLLDQPPSTVAGYDMANKFLWTVPGLFLYSISSDHRIERWELLQNVIRTPRVLSLALELWLFASTTNHRIVQVLCNVLHMFLDFRETDTPEELLSFPKDCKAVCTNTSRWDVPSICIKEIVRVLCQPGLDCDSLRSTLSILLMVSRDLYIESMPRLIAMGVTRWLAIAMSKLASPRMITGYGTFESEAPLDDAACCVKQIMAFMCICGRQDSYSLLDALDGGILISLYRARTLIFTDGGLRGLETNPGPHMVEFLSVLTQRLLHRAILVRVVRSVKKAEKLGFYEPEESFAPFQEFWVRLKDEALSRNSRVTLHSLPHICGFEQVTFLPSSWRDSRCSHSSLTSAQIESRKCINVAAGAVRKCIVRRIVRKQRGGQAIVRRAENIGRINEV
ncbi:hypothetical protein PM082_021167 [Marasmius tenuissimus]|nr:hypothetical protein PM082_021167 [Marasmius tenuissimus]